jgi:hypothetical protein
MLKILLIQTPLEDIIMLRLKTSLLYSVCCISAFLSYACRNNLKRIKKDGYTIEANFVDGKMVDGKASYYDNEGRLLNTTMYRMGIKSGISINYFTNNRVSDSFKFECNKENGYWIYYDSTGNRLYSNYYYYGLQYGPELIYEDNQLKKFLFSNLNRSVIVECYYDHSGDLDSIGRFAMNFGATSKLFNNKPVKNLFAYLPEVPGSSQLFSIGITNKEHQDRMLYSVKGHNFFLDTLLPSPPSGWFYYLACSLKAKNSSINRVYVEEFREPK